jgi:hypothetical protein
LCLPYVMRNVGRFLGRGRAEAAQRAMKGLPQSLCTPFCHGEGGDAQTG